MKQYTTGAPQITLSFYLCEAWGNEQGTSSGYMRQDILIYDDNPDDASPKTA